MSCNYGGSLAKKSHMYNSTQVKNDKDIINRIKYDIFYIENWSILLDIKIIFQTLIIIFKGDEKAY